MSADSTRSEKRESAATTLVMSRFRDHRYDILSLQELERACLECGPWQRTNGPVLFSPVKISTRLFTLLHTLLRPFCSWFGGGGPVVSLGLPYRHYLFGKTFPYFTLGERMRVLWTYDVWEPRWGEIAQIVRESRVDLLLLSSLQATEHFRSLSLPGCAVHWVPETVDARPYQPFPWSEREVDVVAFGRGFIRHHDAIAAGCRERGINYLFNPDYPDRESFVRGLCGAKLSICFPQSMTNPEVAGAVSTLTLRYLQSMAAKCLILGSLPAEAEQLFGYNPVVEVNWNDPVGQIEAILQNPAEHQSLIARNFEMVMTHHQPRNFVAKVEALIRAQVSEE